eukprot:scaffold707_cov399-Prasinococcus_capsulatus_cf.AAC.23
MGTTILVHNQLRCVTFRVLDLSDSDCCSDYEGECTLSCVGNCGDGAYVPGLGSCYCDETCTTYNGKQHLDVPSIYTDGDCAVGFCSTPSLSHKGPGSRRLL